MECGDRAAKFAAWWFPWRGWAIVATAVLVCGCGGRTGDAAADAKSEPKKSVAAKTPVASKSASRTPPAEKSPPRSTAEKTRKFSDLVEDPSKQGGGATGTADLPPDEVELKTSDEVAVDPRRIAAAGIRRIDGARLTLYTDVPPHPEIDVLPAIFDAAYPLWREYFHIRFRPEDAWRVTGCLMRDKAKFTAAGLLPADLPPFLNGYARGTRCWLNEQNSDYYRRHLLLHEGTHVFMLTAFGQYGPPWYGEGVAELLGTHLWKDGKLALGYFPRDRQEVPLWGRVKIVQDGFAAGTAQQLSTIFDYPANAYLRNEPYGWCWAAAAFLDGHPRYRERFRFLPKLIGEADFNNRVKRMYADVWSPLNEEWQVFIAQAEYGYDFGRMAIEFKTGAPLPPGGTVVEIDAARGWQSSGVQLVAGRKYRVRAQGRYTIAGGERPWPCEPGGVSIRYYQGRPLGMLLGAVRADDDSARTTNRFVRPGAIGLEAELQPEQSGTLYLRVNDSPAELADNAGRVTLHIQAD